MYFRKQITGILSIMLAFSTMFSNVTTLHAEEAEPEETAVTETVEELSEETAEQTEETAEEAEQTAEPAEAVLPEVTEEAEETEEVSEPEQEQAEEELVPEETAEEITVPSSTEYGTVDADTGTNDELLQMYIDKQLNLDDGQEDATAQGMGDALTGNNLIIYNNLKAKIEKVAAGDITSTEFTITLDDLGLSGKMWTASDLGVDAVVSNNNITTEAMEALDNLLAIDRADIIYRLLVDCPYDLYWYDKTIGYNWKSFRYSAGYSNGEWALLLTDVMTVSMTVAGEYASDKYVTDSEVISSVSTAVSTIQNVVQSHASESDYNKLVSYRQDICSRVSYNYDAAGNSSTPYGNPWQLIWVFDGDDSTKVVCEGYSKAFKYLCDLSTFRSKDIECYLVTGTMDGGSGAGNHMWNIVTMNDGKNYLVDVTNCDQGSVGADDWLFLVGVTFISTNSFKAVIPERTEGNTIYSGATITYGYDSKTTGLYDRSLLTLSSSKYEPSESVSVTGVALDQTALTLEKGEDAQLTATIAPADADNKNVTWTSSNTAVATVDNTGKVTAVGKGTATITVTTEDGSHTATCAVTVEEHIAVTGVTLDQTTLTLEKGADAQLTATVTPANADNKNVTWTSSNTAVATVDNTGKVTATGKGSATITVTTEDGSHTATCAVTVEEHIAVTGVTLDQTTLTLEKGADAQLTATVTPEDADNKNVTWTSSNTAVAAVDNTGKVTATGKGTATITVTTEDGSYTATCSVTVEEHIAVTGVTIDQTTLILEKGADAQLTATVAPADADNKTVTWTSSNTAVAAVDNTGKVTAVGKGTATITVTTEDGSHTATCSVTVEEHIAVAGVTLDQTTLTLAKGEDAQLTATVTPADADNKNVTWTSSNTAVAAVDNTGKVTATGKGTATITVTTEDGSYTATCAVTVEEHIAVTGVTLDRTDLILTKDETYALTASVIPSNADNQVVSWTSDHPEIASVDEAGNVKGLADGTAVITVTTEDGNYTAQCTVTVSSTVTRNFAFDYSPFEWEEITGEYQKTTEVGFTYTVNEKTGDPSELTFAFSDTEHHLGEISLSEDHSKLLITPEMMGYFEIVVKYHDEVIQNAYINVNKPFYRLRAEDLNEGYLWQNVTPEPLKLDYIFGDGEGDYSALTVKSSDENVLKAEFSEDHRTVYLTPGSKGTTELSFYAPYAVDSIETISFTVKGEIESTGKYLSVAENWDSSDEVDSLSFSKLDDQEEYYGNTLYFYYFIDGVQQDSSGLSIISTDTSVLKISLPQPEYHYVDYQLVGFGTADIEFWDGEEFLKKVTVTNTQPDISYVSLFSSTYALDAGASEQLLYTAKPSYAKPALRTEFTSNNTDIVKVDEAGLMTGVSAGTAFVTVKLYLENGTTVSQTVTVNVGSDEVSGYGYGDNPYVNAGTLVSGEGNQFTLTFKEGYPRWISPGFKIELYLMSGPNEKPLQVSAFKPTVSGSSYTFDGTVLKKYAKDDLEAGNYAVKIRVTKNYNDEMYYFPVMTIDQKITVNAPADLAVQATTDGGGVLISCSDSEACDVYLSKLYEYRANGDASFTGDERWTTIQLSANDGTYHNIPGNNTSIDYLVPHTDETSGRMTSLEVPASVIKAYGFFSGNYTVGIMSKDSGYRDYWSTDEINLQTENNAEALTPKNLEWSDNGHVRFGLPYGTWYRYSVTTNYHNSEDTASEYAFSEGTIIDVDLSYLLNSEYAYFEMYTAPSYEQLQTTAVRYTLRRDNSRSGIYGSLETPDGLQWNTDGSFSWNPVNDAQYYVVKVYWNNSLTYSNMLTGTSVSDYTAPAENPDDEFKFTVRAIGDQYHYRNSRLAESYVYGKEPVHVKADDIPVIVNLNGERYTLDTHVFMRLGTRSSAAAYSVNETKKIPGPKFYEAGTYTYLIYLAQDNASVAPNYDTYRVTYTVTEETDASGAAHLVLAEPVIKNEADEETDEIVFDLVTPKAAEYSPVMNVTLNGSAIGSDLDGQFAFHLKDDEGTVIETVSNTNGKAAFSAIEGLDDIGSYYYTIVPAEYDEQAYVPEHDIIHVVINIHEIRDGSYYPEVRYDLGSRDVPIQDLTFNWFAASYMTVSDDLTIGLTENGKDPAGVYYFERINDATQEKELIASTGSTTTLKGINFGAPGTYAYTITIRNDDPSMIENTQAYHLIYLVEESDGKLVITSSSITDESGNEAESILFSISSKSSASYVPTASVTLDDQAPADGTFEAVLKDDEGNIIETVSNTGDTFTFSEMTFTDIGRYCYSIKISSGSDNYDVDAMEYHLVIDVEADEESLIPSVYYDYPSEDGYVKVDTIEFFNHTVALESIDLVQTESRLYIGQTLNMTVEFNPSNATNKQLKWESSDPAVASVDENGTVTALTTGTAVITVTSEEGDFSDTCTITVEETPEIAIYTDQSELNLTKGEEQQLTVIYKPEHLKDDYPTVWTSSDETVATAENGLVKALGGGTAVITVTCGELTASITVNVSVKLESIYLEETEASLSIEDTYQISVTPVPADATNLKMTYVSSDETVASVDENGLLTGIGQGTAVITITAADGGYTAELTVEVHPNGIYVDAVEDQTYTGTAIKPVLNVYDSGKLLTLGTDYTVTYKNNTNAGTASAVIKMKGNYAGTQTVPFTIEQIDLEGDLFSNDAMSVQATGKIQSPVPVIYWNGKKLKNKTEFIVEDYGGWDQKDGFGPFEITVSGTGNYKGTRTIPMVVAQKGYVALSKTKVTAKALAYDDLTGDAAIDIQNILGRITVKNGSAALKYGEDYVYVEGSAVNYDRAGTCTLIIEGTGEKYFGERTVSVKITGVALSGKAVKVVDPTVYTYTGEEIRLSDQFTLTYNNEALSEEDYEILEDTYTNNVNAGTASVKIEGKNRFSGIRTVKFTIKPDKDGIKEEDIDIDTAYYTKGGSKPAVTIPGLKQGVDYTVSYSNHKAVGTGRVTITGKGNYKGAKVPKDFEILPRNIEELFITASDVVYNAKAGKYKSTPVIKDTDGKALKAGTDYDKTTYVYELLDENGNVVEELNSTSAPAEGSVIRLTVSAKGKNYTGRISTEYRIIAKTMSIAKGTFKIADQVYTGNEILITDMSQFTETNEHRNAYVTVNKEKQYLTIGEDFEVIPGSYQKNVSQGTATVMLRGINNYGGTKTVKFKIVKKNVVNNWGGIIESILNSLY